MGVLVKESHKEATPAAREEDCNPGHKGVRQLTIPLETFNRVRPLGREMDLAAVTHFCKSVTSGEEDHYDN